MSSENRLSELEARLEQLARENQHLAAEVASLKGSGPDAGSEPSAGTALAVATRPVEEIDEVVEVDDRGVAKLDRRKALRNLGGLAAASVGILAAGGMMRPAPAAAEAFTALIIGELQGGAQHSTRLTATPGGASQGWTFDSATFAAENTGSGEVGGRIGLYGRSTDRGVGVYGEGLNGDSSYPSYGVRGTTNAQVTSFFDGVRGAGVFGIGTGSNGLGVHGRSNGTAIYAEGGDTSTHAVGLRASAPGGAPIVIANSSIAVPPVEDSWERGSLVHKDGELWFCVAGGAGTNSRWSPLSANNLVTLATPARVYDSRPGEPPFVGTQDPIANGDLRTVDIAETGDIPTSAKAILANITVVPTTSARGFLTLWKEGETQPTASNANFNGELPMAFANNATVALNDGKLSATVGGQASATVNLIIDVVGYYL